MQWVMVLDNKKNEMLKALEALLREHFAPTMMNIIDDSSKHAGHREKKGELSHLRIVLISAKFIGLTILQRHRMVNEALHSIYNNIHSISLLLSAPGEEKKE